MKNLKPIILVPFVLLYIFFSCTENKPAERRISDNILVNQIGYTPKAPKKAILRTRTDQFTVYKTDGEKVLSGVPGEWKYWKLSGDSVMQADFSEITQPGEYVLCINDTLFSVPFRIETSIYTGLASAALKSYYYARCGVDIDSVFGGKWNWKAGHPDTLVAIHESAADENRPAGTFIVSPGGWYDAGDYGKYVVNSGITTYTLLLSTKLNKTYHEAQNLNIPESNNELPDILDEILVNLNWMLSMQDPNDGGVYHKLTTKKFDGFIPPSETSAQRYVLQKSTSAALDFSATMASASRTLKSYGLNELAEQTMGSAMEAWKWASENPAVFYLQPRDITTGAYGDTSFVDEWFWAATELYVNTNEDQFLEKMEEYYQKPLTPKWDVVNTLGIISVLTSEKREEFPEMEHDFLVHVDRLLQSEIQSPYAVSIHKFAWGSNSDVANDGMLKLIAYKLTGDEKYVASAKNDLDYILGRNATGYSFVTGFGAKSTRNPHNRIMASDGVDDPVPGYLAGGPNISVMNDCDPKEINRSPYPAASYIDELCSYSTNETAINWNAPLVFLVSGLDAINSK